MSDTTGLRTKSAMIAEMRNRPEDRALSVMISRHTWDMCLDVADGCLAMCPADAGEPVTEGWLISLGFTPCKIINAVTIQYQRRRELTVWADGAVWLKETWFGSSDSNMSIATVKTRGELRSLARLLGVSLKEEA